MAALMSVEGGVRPGDPNENRAQTRPWERSDLPPERGRGPAGVRPRHRRAPAASPRRPGGRSRFPNWTPPPEGTGACPLHLHTPPQARISGAWYLTLESQELISQT